MQADGRGYIAPLVNRQGDLGFQTTVFNSRRSVVAVSCEIMAVSKVSVPKNDRGRTDAAQVNVVHKKQAPREGQRKEYAIGTARCIAGGNAEIPILRLLSKSPQGVRTSIVLKEIRAPAWYPMLSETDLSARYPSSKKNCVDTVIKYSKKSLLEKGEVCAPDQVAHAGIWRITEKGLVRLQKDGGRWEPRYKMHGGRLVEV